MNYFNFFNLPFSLNIDKKALRKAYLQNSKQYHPDYHSGAQSEIQTEMIEKSGMNNKGYEILGNPDKILQYVLEVKDLIGEDKKLNVPQDFLMEMMDINETLMELEFDPDIEKSNKLRKQIEIIYKDLKSEVIDIFEIPNLSTLSPDRWISLRDYYLKTKYLQRIKENL